MKKVYSVFFVLLFLFLTTSSVSAKDRLQFTAYKIDQAPKLDGIITQKEWGNPIAAFTKYDANVRFLYNVVDSARWPDDAELYAIWDDEYLYIGAIVTNETHQNNKTNAYIWQEDSLFIRLGLAKKQKAEYRFIFALGGDNISLGYLLNMPNKSLNGTGKTVEILFHYDEYCVARADDKTTYEMRFRWDDYTVDERKIEEGFQFYLNMELNLKGKKKGKTGVMMYGTYDDSNRWQYPQIILAERKNAVLPSPTPMPTSEPLPSLTPVPTVSLTPAVRHTPDPTSAPTAGKAELFSPAPSVTPPLLKSEEDSAINPWWYSLVLIPIALIIAIIVLIKKTRIKRT